MCVGKFPGETCEVSCASGFLGGTSIYTCTSQEVFSGTPPSCVQTTTVTTMTSTMTELVACSGGLPTDWGVNVNDCFGKVNGQTCTVSCMATFQGDSAEYYCNPSTGEFEGPAVTCTKISCNVDQLPSGFDSSGCSNLVAGDFCLVSCQQGFIPAEEKYTCGVDGNFSGTPPQCERVICPADTLPVAPGVNVSGCIGTVSGASCEVACELGYQGSASMYSCGLDGAFTGTAPVCERKTCALPDSFSIYSHTCDGIQHGAGCTISCAAGYSGSSTEQVCSDGSLLGDLPSCTPDSCSFAGMNIPTAIDVSPCVGAVSGQTCDVQCQRGYLAVGSLTVQCLSSGSFTAISASCEPQPCGNLTDLQPFATSDIGQSCDGVVAGQVCTAFCQAGYTISGNATVLICGEGPDSSNGYTEFMPGTEDSLPAEQSTGPDCAINTCTEGVPDNPMLSHNCSNVATGQRCLVDAVVPYQLTGGAVELTCEASGHLTGTIPAIIPAVCPSISFGTGAGSTCDQIEYGGDCWAYCQSGYEGTARQYRCELVDGSVQLQSVVADISCATVTQTVTTTAARRLASLDPCPATSVTQVGLGDQQYLHDCTDKLHDEACIAHCGFGYDMQESAPVVFTCQNSALVGAGLPTCMGRTCNYALPTGLGVSHDCTSKTTGQTCEASCGQAGYTYASNSNQQQFTCLGSGIFEGVAPTCEPISCTDLDVGSRFSHNCRGKRFGETCGISCATGYHKSGWGSQLTCSSDGTFTGSLPSCVGNPCANSLVSDWSLDSDQCNGLATGQTCTVSCKAGFTPNSATMVCDATGFLTGTVPACTPLTCETSSELSDASIRHTCNQVSFNRSCAVTCAAGYKLTSGTAQEWSCNWNPTSSSLSLSGSLPACEADLCTSGLPTDSERTIANCSSLRTGETCQQRCASGYVGTDAAFTCESDGAARTASSSAQCQPVTCNLTVSDSSIGHVCTDVAFGYSCSAFCNKGYTSTNGVQTLTCAGPESGGSAVGNADNASITLRGSLPVCLGQVCFFNFPTGSQFTHNCDGIRTGESCTSSCVDGWDGQSTTLTCGVEGGLQGSFPVCTLQTVTKTATQTSTTRTSTDFELQINVAGTLRLNVNNSNAFIQDVDAQRVVGEVIAGLIGVSVEQLQLSLTAVVSSGRRLAFGGVQAAYSTWFVADTQEMADALGNNITAQLDAAGVPLLQQLLVDAMTQISSDKVAFYSVEVLAHNADIIVGTRKQETVAKSVAVLCNPSTFPVITGAGPFDCQEPQILGQSCRAPCDSGAEFAVITCEEQGWTLQDECPTESYLLVIIFASAAALCCLIITCVVLCACRGGGKTAPEVIDEPPPLPQPLPSIRDVPQPENYDTGYYSWAERWEQSRQNQGTDIPLVAPASLTNTVPDSEMDRSPQAIPMPPERPPPVEQQKSSPLIPPPLPSLARRDGTSPKEGEVQLDVKADSEPEQIIVSQPEDLREVAQQEDLPTLEDLDLTTVDAPMTLHVQRISGSLLAKITSTSKQTVAELISSIKEVAGPGMNLTLTCSTKVLRPEQTLEEIGLYDGSVVTAIRQPELFVAAAFEDGTAAVWSVESGKLERSFECRYGSVKSVTLAQPGLILVLGMVDGTVQLWNVVTGKFMRQFSGHMGAIFSVASSPNGKLLATGCFDGTSKLLNTETGRVIRVCSGHRGSIKSLCFSTDSRTLATGSEDCNVKLWKVLDRSGELTLSGHTSTITAISFSHYGKALASGAENGEVNAWSAVSGRLVWELPRASSAVKSLAFSRDGVSLAVGAFDGECTFYSATTRACTSRVQCTTPSPFHSMGFSPAGHLFICGTEAGELHVYGTEDGESRKVLEACAAPSMISPVAAVAVSAGPVPKKPKGSRRRSDLAVTDSELPEAPPDE